MGRKDNLKAPRSSEEARERGRKGGKASGVARRKKRDAKETAMLFLGMAATGNLDTLLSQLDVKEQDRTNQMGIVARLAIKAQTGDVQAARLIWEITGQLPKSNTENNFSVNFERGKGEVAVYLPQKDPDPV